MSAQGSVPAARPAPRALTRGAWAAAALAVLAAGAVLLWGARDAHEWEVLAVSAPAGGRIAIVRATACGTPPCQTLWIGAARDEATRVAALAPGTEHCSEIAWSPDGTRVGFVVNGYQLRMYDAATLVPAGQVRLLEPDGDPPARIARGVTFSENGRAVTFDDCPRARSGCRAGLAAIPAGR